MIQPEVYLVGLIGKFPKISLEKNYLTSAEAWEVQCCVKFINELLPRFRDYNQTQLGDVSRLLERVEKYLEFLSAAWDVKLKEPLKSLDSILHPQLQKIIKEFNEFPALTSEEVVEGWKEQGIRWLKKWNNLSLPGTLCTLEKSHLKYLHLKTKNIYRLLKIAAVEVEEPKELSEYVKEN